MTKGKLVLIACMAMALSVSAFGQQRTDTFCFKEMPYIIQGGFDRNIVFDVVEEMPRFPGGPSAMMAFIDSVKVYPKVAEENCVQGRVIVTFIVEKDGSLSNIEVVKGVDPALDKEAIRVVRKMPKWIPGRQNGVIVKVKYCIPITFRLK